jgi:hypothetical protein
VDSQRIWSDLSAGLKAARKNQLLDANELREIHALREVRNRAAHGQPGWEEMLSSELVDKTLRWAARLKELATVNSDK